MPKEVPPMKRGEPPSRPPGAPRSLGDPRPRWPRLLPAVRPASGPGRATGCAAGCARPPTALRAPGPRRAPVHPSP